MQRQRRKAWARAAWGIATALWLGCGVRSALEDADAPAASTSGAGGASGSGSGSGVFDVTVVSSASSASSASGGCFACEVQTVPLAVGLDHSCAVLPDGRLKCWGHSALGELGLGGTETYGDEPGEMGDNLPAVDLGTGAKALAVSAGFSHTCALLNDGRVKCWGSNLYGELGLGDSKIRGDEPGEMGDKLPAVDL